MAPVTNIKNPVTDRKYSSNQVVVRFKTQNNSPSISNDKIRKAHEKTGARIKKDFGAEGLVGLQVIVLPNGTDVKSAIREYQSNPDVLYAEPDYIISISPIRPVQSSRAQIPCRSFRLPMIPSLLNFGDFTIPAKYLETEHQVRILMQRPHGISQLDRTVS